MPMVPIFLLWGGDWTDVAGLRLDQRCDRMLSITSERTWKLQQQHQRQPAGVLRTASRLQEKGKSAQT